MIKKSINPFAIMYAFALIIGCVLANVFMRRNLVNQVLALKKENETLKMDIEALHNFDSKHIENVLEDMEVQDIMKIVSEKRGFECSCIKTETLKMLLDGKEPDSETDNL